MANSRTALPELMPILSRGKHRSPRRGACFMELASYLAGERWSDHPACTHPLLSRLARGVNDYTSDAGRPALAGLIPTVIGLTSDDPRVDARIALGAALVALPVAAAERQRIMACAVIACERFLAEQDGRPAGTLSATSRSALDQVPDATRWAEQFAKAVRTSAKPFRRHSAPSIVRYAVEGVAFAAVPNPDPLLREQLVIGIQACGGTPANPVSPAAWTAACQLTGVR